MDGRAGSQRRRTRLKSSSARIERADFPRLYNELIAVRPTPTHIEVRIYGLTLFVRIRHAFEAFDEIQMILARFEKAA